MIPAKKTFCNSSLQKNQIVYVQNNHSKYDLCYGHRSIRKNNRALDFEFVEDATSQRKTALNLDKQTRPPYHSQINPSFSKRGHFCWIKYSYNILDQVQNHFC